MPSLPALVSLLLTAALNRLRLMKLASSVCPSPRPLTTSAWSSRERTALLVFAIVSTVIPWAGVFVLRSHGWHHTWSIPLFVVASAFCSLAGIAAVLIQHGWAEGRLLLWERLRLQGGWRPWGMFIWWGPVWMLLAYGLYTLTQGLSVEPRWTALSAYLSAGVLWLFLTGPLGEEFGWRGYLLPALMQRWSFTNASPVIGVWWALWHTPLMLDRWTGDPLHLPYFVANVVVFSFMLGAVFRVGGLLPTMAVHWGINASQEVVPHVFGYQGAPEKVLWLYISGVLVVLAVLGIRFLLSSPAERRARRYDAGATA